MGFLSGRLSTGCSATGVPHIWTSYESFLVKKNYVSTWPDYQPLRLYERFNVRTYMAVTENGKIHMSYHTEHIKLNICFQ